MTARVVAIDGAAGSGKSTLARALARELGLAYVNTGLMYRALTAAALRMDVDLDDGDALANLISRLSFTLTDGPTPELEVEGWSESALTVATVEGQVSRVARHPQVRELMRALQRGLGERWGAVMEGRDIGSVVFPDAQVKIFLEADPTAREARRVDERAGSDAEVATALHARDARDAAVNPFVPATDAIVIDTTDLDPARTLARALAIVRERL
jgi:cytidylate kinase